MPCVLVTSDDSLQLVRVQVFTKAPGIGSPQVSRAFGTPDRLRSLAELSQTAEAPAGSTRLRPRPVGGGQVSQEEEPFVWSACARGLCAASGSAARWGHSACVPRCSVCCCRTAGGPGLLLLLLAALCSQLCGS